MTFNSYNSALLYVKEMLVVGFTEFPYLIDLNEFHLILPHNRAVDSSVTMNEPMFGEWILKQSASVMLKSAAAQCSFAVLLSFSFPYLANIYVRSVTNQWQCIVKRKGK